ncbi:metal ABC transporter substrate-binding protein [Cellulomonas phragmiteti]|uniref:Zinc ABC transporter substrate-binding protein n=1 Tax=Cellulomonas phragmiteti TaxID=478780 RepID=A0ABQ4DKQ2_9CELL|nr:metal ABC transporter substrate-binding protein [Cellulomonas phragmiteti]GIG39932.1 hypothetical protein Cph01nite_16940 [Cellulomonas phragmiteti]
MSRFPRRTLAVVAALAAPALALTACAATEPGTADDETVRVLASFYPLQMVVEQVGGERVEASSLTPPGSDPHGLELSPAQVASLGAAQLVVYQSGFQPAVDDALEQTSPEHVVDATRYADLLTTEDEGHDEEPAAAEAPAADVPTDDTATDDGHGHDEHGHEDEHGHDDEHAAEEHATEEHTADDHATEDHAAEDHDGHDHGGLDPHFWLDPSRMPAVAEAVADALTEVDPGGADTYRANAEALSARFTELDADYAAGLATCERRVMVTTHEAFGYLAHRYDLRQVGISGIDPETEPSPARLREVASIVEAEGVTTIFFETLVSPKVAETLAADLGVDTAVLDPLEGLVDDTQDYFSIAGTNLESLRVALSCS